MALTPKQQQFVREYLVDLNATQAAIRAGYSPATAEPAASRLLRNVKVAAAIAEAQAARSQRTEVTADYVLGNLKEVVERCMQKAPVTGAWGAQFVDAEGRHVWEFDPKASVAALNLLGKHLGLFLDRVKHEGGIALVEDANWYDNQAHDAPSGASPPQGPPPSAPGPAEPGPQ